MLSSPHYATRVCFVCWNCSKLRVWCNPLILTQLVEDKREALCPVMAVIALYMRDMFMLPYFDSVLQGRHRNWKKCCTSSRQKVYSAWKIGQQWRWSGYPRCRQEQAKIKPLPLALLSLQELHCLCDQLIDQSKKVETHMALKVQLWGFRTISDSLGGN